MARLPTQGVLYQVNMSAMMAMMAAPAIGQATVGLAEGIFGNTKSYQLTAEDYEIAQNNLNDAVPVQQRAMMEDNSQASQSGMDGVVVVGLASVSSFGIACLLLLILVMAAS